MGIETQAINIKTDAATISGSKNSLKSGLQDKNIEIFNTPDVAQKEDLSNNKKFDFSEAAKNFWTGIKKPFKDVIEYAKENPIQAAIIGGACIGLTALALSSSTAAFALTALGCYFIAKPLIKGIDKSINAKNGDDVEKAFVDFGESASYTGLTFGTNILSFSKLNTASTILHTGGKNIISLWSNATDVASFGPKSRDISAIGSKFPNLTRAFLRSGEVSYEVSK